MPPPLDSTLVTQVLAYLDRQPAPPSLNALNALLAAYVRRVPWESASRIARRAKTESTEDCPRWPETFWHQAMTHGTGGTCYESNLAFFSLLRFLGYQGYLTINNMDPAIGCHAAIVIQLDKRPLLVDVGLPVHACLPLDATMTTVCQSPFHNYSAIPGGDGTFTIKRDRHPNAYCYTLIDTPVLVDAYRAILRDDYHPETGQFLHRVILVKVIDEVVWRFSSADGVPYQMESFPGEGKTYYFLGADPLETADKVAAKFGVEREIVRAAMEQVIKLPPGD